jgi:peptidoglycan/LPS O-acetylase OafA/YrhL
MSGTYCLILALLVVIQYLLSIPVVGYYAVHGFFILSGYLMTYVMANTYGYSLHGCSSFIFNRFLRLFPSYWFYLALTVLAIGITGQEYSKEYREFIYLPNSLTGFIQNITMVYWDLFPGKVEPRLLPASWALTVELLFYFLIAIGVSKNKKISLIWLAGGIIYMAYTHLINLEYSYPYDFIFSGSLPFSLGAIAYHYRTEINKYIKKVNIKYGITMAITLFFINIVFALAVKLFSLNEFLFYLSFYLNYVINIVLICLLINFKSKEKLQKIDHALGYYSYPLYLFREPVC